MNQPQQPAENTSLDADEVVEVIEEAEARITASIAPNHRDMYILLAGLIVGFLLSPWCAGRFMEPKAFEQFYYGSGEQWQALEDFKAEQQESRAEKIRELLERHQAVDATDDAYKVDAMALEMQLNEQFAEQRIPYRAEIEAARHDHGEWIHGASFAIVLAIAVLMFLEPMFEPLGSLAAVRNGMATGRYALAAAWLAAFIAQPHMRLGVSVLFMLLLVLAALVGAVGPWLMLKNKAKS